MMRFVSLVGVGLVLSMSAAWAAEGSAKPADAPKAACPACPIAAGVDAALKQLPAAEKAVTGGRKDEALKELAAVRATLEQVQKDLAAMRAKMMKAGATSCPAASGAIICPTTGKPCTKGCTVPCGTDAKVTCPADCKMPCCAGKKAEPAKGAEGPKGVVNDVCPIMGAKMDAAKVPDSLTRTYKGVKVGFCCAGCPARWDSMSDAKKAEFVAKYAK